MSAQAERPLLEVLIDVAVEALRVAYVQAKRDHDGPLLAHINALRGQLLTSQHQLVEGGQIPHTHGCGFNTYGAPQHEHETEGPRP